ncbi:MAG: phenylalanine--tRNA ligase subunit beta [Cyanobacteria bacterium]|nr:phenylalanine--tRNA ligase subunit beta [Cyanobacteriota bacterium]MDA1246134.1 phenylalanine--tRNA ligase subunit beta [Cyanobacteriota bacterium]
MRVSLQWLQELVTGPEQALASGPLAERLSLAGFEVDAIEDLAAQAGGVVVGFVRERQTHPNADKLSVCQVDIGAAEMLQIVCGATNVRAGIHVPVALVGATLPAVNLTIKPAELRGMASSGMICSLAELGLAAEADGIAILDDLLDQMPPLGAAIGPSLGLDDQVLELAITANRPDGLSMQGIAREVAALVGGQTLITGSKSAAPSEQLPFAAIDRAAVEAGGLFSITALDGVKVAPSPQWLQVRLQKAGIRPINNIVDITNLVMLETGQPLHAFDSKRLAVKGGESEAQLANLGLRQAFDGEAFTSLDTTEHKLSPEALVVTYSNRPIALAGVMGGADEAVTEATISIWLEAAVFAPQAVRRSARSVGLRTEASSRFEKGLPREATLAAADRAVELLIEHCGAKASGRWLHQCSEQPIEPLLLRRDALHNLLGQVREGEDYSDLSDDRIVQTLTALGCKLAEKKEGEGWLVNVPPSRLMDLQREVDLIEEVARLVGYDHFACHLPDPLEPGGLTPAQKVERRLRRQLCAAGLQEACSFSLVPAAEGRIPLANPLLADYGYLRDNLHDELLAAARRNLQGGQLGFWAFEIGQVFSNDADKSDHQLLAGVICGERRGERWSSSGKPQPPSYHQARGLLQQALASISVPIEDRPLRQHPLLHPGRGAQLVVEGKPQGWFGQLHPEKAESLDLPQTCFIFELELDALITAATRRNRWQPAFAPYATVPASERDLAVVVPLSTNSAELLQVIRKAGKPLLEHAELVDRYEGGQLAADQCSQAFRLRYRDASRTLTDEEVELAHSSIRTALGKQLGAQLRS